MAITDDVEVPPLSPPASTIRPRHAKALARESGVRNRQGANEDAIRNGW
jgi:hypothetical protein